VDILPTVAGVLMVGKVEALSRFVPTMQSSFQVTEGTAVRVNVDFALPILATIEKINAYVDAWNQEHEIEMGLFRMPVPDFDKRALREAIVNAYSHRDYSKMGRVRIAFSDDGLTIANPGGFIEGVSVQNLLTAEPHGRNPLLADALKRVGLAERTGRGIDRIFEGSLIYGRMLPDYSASTAVTVSLFIPKSKPDIQLAQIISNEQNRLGRPLPTNTLLVLNILKDAPRSTVEQLAETVNLPQSVIKVILEKAVEAGLVEAFGNGKGRGYLLARSLYNDNTHRVGYVLQKDIDKKRHLELIESLARESEFISKSDVIQLLHVSDERAYYLIKKLVNAGVLEAVHKGRYAKYRFARKS
jgi:ATP-dependent DNA helicase RecG